MRTIRKPDHGGRLILDEPQLDLPGLILPEAARAIGFTGSRLGMSPEQKRRLRHLLIIHEATELHHGDCYGADVEAHEIARQLGLRVVVHPPTAKGLRAHCEGDEIRHDLPFLARNHMIVRETQFLIAAPSGAEQLRSGTWATIRYCRLRHKPHEVMSWK